VSFDLTPERLADHLWRLALPSRTLPPFDHTNSYVIAAAGEGLLVDLGADDPAVLAVLPQVLAALGVSAVHALLLTHTHPDHCAGAEAFQRRFGVPVYVHPSEQQRLPFQTQPLGDDQKVALGDLDVRALHTPGHSPGHLAFWLPWAEVVLVGDLLAAQGSTWVGVPEGDVAAYLASLARLSALPSRLLAPGHGEIVRDPAQRLAEVRQHRLEREAQVLAALGAEALTPSELRTRVYPELHPKAHPELAEMAERSLQAHLDKLQDEGRVVARAGRYARA
jgi:ribonuclease/clavin/mitogillin